MAEKEKEVVVRGRETEDDKLGAVTYQDPDKTGQPVTISGITFMPGDSVNLDEMLPEDQASRLKKKLAGNQFFKVEGGQDHTKVTEARMKHEEEAQRKKAEAAEKAQQQAQRQQQPQQQQPGDWKGPETAHLEHDSRGAAKRK